MQGERANERERDGNIGKRSFNGAENDGNGEEGGWERAEKTLCSVQSQDETGKTACHCMCISFFVLSLSSRQF